MQQLRADWGELHARAASKAVALIRLLSGTVFKRRPIISVVTHLSNTRIIKLPKPHTPGSTHRFKPGLACQSGSIITSCID